MVNLVFTIANHETLNPTLGWDDVVVHRGIIIASGGHKRVVIDCLTF
jgi:hypothetical protein